MLEGPTLGLGGEVVGGAGDCPGVEGIGGIGLEGVGGTLSIPYWLHTAHDKRIIVCRMSPVSNTFPQ